MCEGESAGTRYRGGGAGKQREPGEHGEHWGRGNHPKLWSVRDRRPNTFPSIRPPPQINLYCSLLGPKFQNEMLQTWISLQDLQRRRTRAERNSILYSYRDIVSCLTLYNVFHFSWRNGEDKCIYSYLTRVVWQMFRIFSISRVETDKMCILSYLYTDSCLMNVLYFSSLWRNE